MRCPNDPGLAEAPLEKVIAQDLASGTLDLVAPYGEVHRQNVAASLAAAAA